MATAVSFQYIVRRLTVDKRASHAQRARKWLLPPYYPLHCGRMSSRAWCRWIVDPQRAYQSPGGVRTSLLPLQRQRIAKFYRVKRVMGKVAFIVIVPIPRGTKTCMKTLYYRRKDFHIRLCVPGETRYWPRALPHHLCLLAFYSSYEKRQRHFHIDKALLFREKESL